MSLLPVGTAARPRLRPRVLWSGSVDQATRLPETVIAFAGEKWVFLAHFSGAEVMPVSRLPCWGRAVVLLVSTSPRCRANRPCPGLVGDVAHEAGCGGGFAALEAGWLCVVGVSYL